MSNYKHGHGSRDATGTYRTWAAMKRRCDNPNAQNYKFYGAKGITYEERWEKFANFLADMGNRPDDTTLGRIDSKMGYCKSNCYWATKKEQSTDNLKLSTAHANLIKELYQIFSHEMSGREFAELTAPIFDISSNTLRRLLTDPSYRALVDE